MIYKLLIGSLAICGLTACGNSKKPEGLWVSYGCRDLTASENGGIILHTKTRLKTSPRAPNFNFAGTSLRGYEMYEASIYYYNPNQNSNNLNSLTTQEPFRYQNIDFEYLNNDLILRVPEYEDFPTCEIKFNKGDIIGEHKCNFENDDKDNRAKTFQIKCEHSGKMRHIQFDNENN